MDGQGKYRIDRYLYKQRNRYISIWMAREFIEYIYTYIDREIDT